MSIVPNRGACVTMLMPLRMMYVSTPSGDVASLCMSSGCPLRLKIRVTRWLPGMMGTTGGSGPGRPSTSRSRLIGQGGHRHRSVGTGQRLEVRRPVSGPGVRFGT